MHFTDYVTTDCAIKGCYEPVFRDLRFGKHRFCYRHAIDLVDGVKNRYQVYYGEKNGLIKIGHSGNVPRRAQELGIEILATEPGGITQERITHFRFSDLRVGGSEWFIYDGSLARYIKKLSEIQYRKSRRPYWQDEWDKESRALAVKGVTE